jgi:hypothetical protein
MLDNEPDTPMLGLRNGTPYAHGRQAEDLVRQLALGRAAEVYGQRQRGSDVQVEQYPDFCDPSAPFSDVGGIEGKGLAVPCWTTEPQSMPMDHLDQGYHGEAPLMEEAVWEEERGLDMAGFWKPNMLY